VIHLYRRTLKLAPTIIRSYQLHFTLKDVRKKFRSEFERFKDVKDPLLVDMLVFKGEHELEEAAMFWKTRPHALRYFTPIRKEVWENENLKLDDKESLKQFLKVDKNSYASHEKFK